MLALFDHWHTYIILTNPHQYPATCALLAANTTLFIATQRSARFKASLVQDRSRIRQGEWWRILTAMFTHHDVLHFGCNMLSLINLGLGFERAMKSSNFLRIFFLAGLGAGGLAYIFKWGDKMLGASNALYGVTGAGSVLLWVMTGRGLLTYDYLIKAHEGVARYTNYPSVSYKTHFMGLLIGVMSGWLLFGHRYQPGSTASTY